MNSTQKKIARPLPFSGLRLRIIPSPFLYPSREEGRIGLGVVHCLSSPEGIGPFSFSHSEACCTENLMIVDVRERRSLFEMYINISFSLFGIAIETQAFSESIYCTGF